MKAVLGSARHLGLLAAIGTLLLSGCSPELRQPQDVLLLLDVTCSTRAADIRADVYEPSVRMLAEGLGRRDQLQQVRVSTIDDATFLNPQWEVSIRFDPYNPSEESELDYEKERLPETRARFIEEVDSFLGQSLSEPPSECRSDVLGAFSKASTTFSAPPEGLSSASKHLVLFSDMIQATDEMTFRVRDGFDLADPDAVTEFIKERRASGLLPSLSGASVYVFAPGLQVGVQLSPERQQLIQTFWTKYVTAAGGRIASYGPQPRLP